MIRNLLLLTVLPACLFAQPTAADVAKSLREAGLDPEECYRIRDLNFTREDFKFYLNDGFIIFARPVNGHRNSAVFYGEVEGGDAELILLPPFRSERQSLGSFTGSPNLDEHFRSALFVFGDKFSDELLLRARQNGKKSAEQGLLLDGQYSSVVRNISDSFQMRLVEDLMNPAHGDSLFFGAIGSNRLGNFDVIYDPRSREQILVGQLKNKGNTYGYDIWTSFESRSVRKGTIPRLEADYAVSDYRIDAVLDDSLHLTATTRLKVTASRTTRALAFQISDRMRLHELKMDGKPVELYTSESLRATALGNGGSVVFLVIAPQPLEPGQVHELEFRHEGDVVFKAGNGVFAVGSRGTWYPHRASDFTTYDLTFHYPKTLNLVATGEVVADQMEGNSRMTHRRTSGLARFAGFNLGQYDRVAMNRGGYTLEIYGNKHVESTLEHKQLPINTAVRLGRHGPGEIVTIDTPPITPGAYLTPLAEEVAGAFEFMMKQFGPPPLKTLTVSPIPGTFGQGFPGLVYLSTISYLPPDQRPTGMRDKVRQTFFSDMLAPHEVAHQWWGNLVTAEAYQDAWLMEALANYSALMYLEKRKGTKALEAVLDEYRLNLEAKRENGDTVESLGPITWGTRLQSSDSLPARTIVYEKGSWILHMLRLRMGDERFMKMLNEICRRYKFKTISTTIFRSIAEEFLPPGKTSLEIFFDGWIHGTGIPTLKVSSSTKGRAPDFNVTATITQSNVDEDFSVEVPVEFQFATGPAVVKWVRTSNDPVTVTLKTKRAPSKVVVPNGSVLAKR